MITMRQLVKSYKRKKKKRRNLVNALDKCPFKRGVVTKVFIEKPKKPNSAKRKVARVLLSNHKSVVCHVPGKNIDGKKADLTKHANVLIRGGRAQDLIGVRYKIIRGQKFFDLPPVLGRISRRTKFGIK